MYRSLSKSRKQMVLIGLIICMITVMRQYNYNEYMQGFSADVNSALKIISDKHEIIQHIDLLSNKLHRKNNARREEQRQLRENNDINLFLNIIVSHISIKKIMILGYMICFIDQVIKFIQAQDGPKRKLLPQ